MDAVLDLRSEARRAWLQPLPGGEERYKRTLDAVLAWIERERPPVAALAGALGGAGSAPACLALLEATGLGRHDESGLALTEAGRAYAADPDPEQLFARLHGAYAGLLETLVLADTWGLTGAAQRVRLFAGLCGPGAAGASASRRAGHRRRWLTSLGLLSRRGTTHAVSLLGRQVLGAHAAEVTEIRKRIEDLLEEEREADLSFAEAMEDLPGAEVRARDEAALAGPSLPSLDEHLVLAGPSPSRFAERVALTVASLRPHLAHLDLPEALLAQTAAALSSGKHLLLVGPPGTGKTELALGLGAAAAAAGYARGMRTATASADWTTFETVGGYAMEPDGALRFRPGVLPAALEQEQWLLVDELNRADVERAFGELYTVLAGRGSTTPFRGADGRAVSIGPEPDATYRVQPSFRLVATLNTWDRASLYRLSGALLRRFAVVHVGPPDELGYARLLDQEAGAPDSGDPPLDPRIRAALGRLFCAAGLLGACPVGPAIALDMVRYCRRRGAGGEGLAEAVALILLPQLEGLPVAAALSVASLLDAELSTLVPPTPARALDEVRARLRDLCPDFEAGRALPLPPRMPRSRGG